MAAGWRRAAASWPECPERRGPSRYRPLVRRNVPPLPPLAAAGRIAVIVPCLNEAAAIGSVVDDLLDTLPGAVVHVYDNGSTDSTAEVARAHGALVRTEPRPGKGNVIRRAFADVDADTYVLIDGDDTYDAGAAAELVQVLLAGPHDHVVGARRPGGAEAYRRGHAAGNRALNAVVSRIFGTPVTDMLSGYRVMSRRFVKSFPALSRGFEVETELTVHAVNLRVPQVEVPVGFRERGAGSESKLRTYRDGARIATWIARLAHYERPAAVHALVGAALTLAAFALGVPVVLDFFATGLVPRQPTAVLASSLVLLAALVAAVGVVLDAVRRARDEVSRLAYLRHPAPGVPTPSVPTPSVPAPSVPAGPPSGAPGPGRGVDLTVTADRSGSAVRVEHRLVQ